MTAAPDPTYTDPCAGWTIVSGTGNNNGVVTGALLPGGYVYAPAGSLGDTTAQPLGFVSVPEPVFSTSSVPGLAVPGLAVPGAVT